jgi:hypothetical protein
MASERSKLIDVVRDVIDLSNPDQVRDWTEALGVSTEALSDAVSRVGNRCEQVRGYFGNIRE